MTIEKKGWQSLAPADRSVIESLDGIRGLAICLVVAFHLEWVGFGWTGVQLFFVLSGFLITRLLLARAGEHGLGDYLIDFYRRRSLRILPLYFGLLVVTALVVYAAGIHGETRAALPYASTFTLNLIYLPALSSAPFVFTHFWSLCVEEHFYLFWPFAIFFLRDRLGALCIALIVAGPLVRALTGALWIAGGGRLEPYVVVNLFSTSHIDAFASGALLCAIPALSERITKRAVGLLLLALGVGFFARHQAGWLQTIFHYKYVWIYTLINLLSALSIVLAIGHGPVRRIFSWGWLRSLGRISYGLYVFHYPLLFALPSAVAAVEQQVGASTATRLGCKIVYLAVLLILAKLSYRYFESPFLKLKDRRGEANRVAMPAKAVG